MNKKKSTRKLFPIVATVLLGTLTVFSFVLQILTTNPSTTQLDAALFNIIQFTLSIGFGWVLTRMVTKEEYEDSMKHFAISAYRRIADIEKMVNRLLGEVETMRGNYPSDSYHALDIVRAIVIDTSETIRSSIADWADIIGEELSTLQEIEALETQKRRLEAKQTTADDERLDDERLNKLEKQIDQLVTTLPARLRFNQRRTQLDVLEASEQLASKHKDENGLRLNAFWDSSFDVDPCNLNTGDRLQLSIGSVGDRDKALIAWTKESKSVGVVTNAVGSTYNNFLATFRLCFPEKVDAQIAEIEQEHFRGKEERHYFTLRILSELRE